MKTALTAEEKWMHLSGVPTFIRGDHRLIRTAAKPLQLLAVTVLIAALVVVTIGLMDLGNVFEHPWLLTGILLGSFALGFLVIATGFASIGLFSARWFLRTLWRGGSGMLHVLPLLLVAVTFFFITAETWQSIGKLKGAPLIVSSLLLVGVAVAFLAKQGAADIDGLGTFTDAEDVRQALPADLRPTGSFRYRVPALTWGERANLMVLSVLGKAFAAAVVGLAIFAFFVIFGLFTITSEVAGAWSAGEPTVWWQLTVARHTYTLTAEHLRVSAFLGVFSALYFVVSSSSDRELALSLSKQAQDHVRRCLAVRAVYRGRR